MPLEYIKKKYIKESVIEKRDYQINLANQAISENCMVVLPTGLGKTTVALYVIAECLQQGTGGVLFLAPTRVLVNQHHDFLNSSLTIDDISLVTGEDSIKKRKQKWINSVVCATPEITKNDLDRGLVDPAQFSLIIFDEAHRTVGDYAYSSIAQRFTHSNVRILGMTATLPSEKDKAIETLAALRIQSVAQRTEEDLDVKPYVQQTHTTWVNVNLPKEMQVIQDLLKKALDQRYLSLKKNGLDLGSQRSLSALLRVRQFVLRQNRRCAKPLFTAIRITYALNIFEAHGITSFLRFCDRTQKKKGIGINELFEVDSYFSNAIRLAKSAQAQGMEHSKIPELIKILKDTKGKVLIFTSYRDSVDVISQNLNNVDIPNGILIGKAGETGLKQKTQIENIQKFRDGVYNVLIATRVGEEGLDISEVNLVIFYDNVPSSIRYVQRRGRTGRKDSGRLIVLIAKGTIDEAYYWIGKRKMSTAKGMGARMTQHLNLEQSKKQIQKTVDGFV